MGLDAFIKRVPVELVRHEPWVDAEMTFVRDHNYLEEIGYFRKHGVLQNWMCGRYVFQGGKDPSFNCKYLRLWEHDIFLLLGFLRDESKHNPDGFFFGSDPDGDKVATDIKFFENLLKEADFNRFAYFYSAWY